MCWTVDFDRNGSIVNQQAGCDPDEVLPDTDVDGAMTYDVVIHYVSGSSRVGVRAALTQ